MINNIFETLNWLKYAAVLMVHSSLLLLMTNRRGGSALACTSLSSTLSSQEQQVFKENMNMLMAEGTGTSLRCIQNLSTSYGQDTVKKMLKWTRIQGP